jgi:exodeoxyribonuclease VII large subunit
MRVGVITSATGAAVQDILNILGRRFPMTTVVLCPVQVQGAQAAPEIAAAIRRMNEQSAADVLIVGRGGGSVEDLWAFNEEIVARAVASSAIPVISAVGHETDFTICDFAADLRAPTPSAAAELAVPDSMEERGVLYSFEMRARRAVYERLRMERLRLESLSRKADLGDPRVLFTPHRLRLDGLSERADRCVRGRLQTERGRLSLVCGKLDAMNPMKVLTRGYAIAEKDGAAVTDARTLSAGDRLLLRFSRGVAACTVEKTQEEPT